MSHIHILTQDTTTFTFLLTSLESGLKSLDVSISSSCAAACDALAGFYFKNVVQVGLRLVTGGKCCS